MSKRLAKEASRDGNAYAKGSSGSRGPHDRRQADYLTGRISDEAASADTDMADADMAKTGAAMAGQA